MTVKTSSKIVTTMVVAGFVSSLGVPAASASNYSGSVTFLGESPALGSVSYVDSRDRLCVKANKGRLKITAIPVNGSGSSYSVTDSAGTAGNTCSGNLSIPEDKQYKMKYDWKGSNRHYVDWVQPGRFYS